MPAVSSERPPCSPVEEQVDEECPNQCRPVHQHCLPSGWYVVLVIERGRGENKLGAAKVDRCGNAGGQGEWWKGDTDVDSQPVADCSQPTGQIRRHGTVLWGRQHSRPVCGQRSKRAEAHSKHRPKWGRRSSCNVSRVRPRSTNISARLAAIHRVIIETKIHCRQPEPRPGTHPPDHGHRSSVRERDIQRRRGSERYRHDSETQA